MATVTLNDLDEVYVDGQLAGKLCDTIVNMPHLASDIQRAFAESRTARKAYLRSEVLKELSVTHENLIAQINSAEQILAAINEQIVAKQAQLSPPDES